MSLTIASVNVNGIRAACKQRNELNPGMNAWLQETSAHIVLMQEVRANPAQTESALKPALEAGWHLAMADALTPGAKGRAGVGILSRTPLTDVETGFGSFLESGRWIEATTAGVRVASLYLPSGDVKSPKLDEKYNFLDEFADVLDERAQQYPEMVIGGDWNICHRAQDLKNNKPNEKQSGHLPEERAFMDHVFGAFPDAEPQSKKAWGTGWEPLTMKPRRNGKQPKNRSGLMLPAAWHQKLTVRTPGGPTADKLSTMMQGGALTTRPQPILCCSAHSAAGWKRRQV